MPVVIKVKIRLMASTSKCSLGGAYPHLATNAFFCICMSKNVFCGHNFCLFLCTFFLVLADREEWSIKCMNPHWLCASFYNLFHNDVHVRIRIFDRL